MDYVQDIYKYLRFLEREQSVIPEYLSGQTVILPKMRAVLVDWIVGVHLQFRLLPETLYTSVAILDRFVYDYYYSEKNKNQLVILWGGEVRQGWG